LEANGPLQKTILVVADNLSKLAALTMILRSLGYFVLEAGDGDEAIRQYEAHPGPIELVAADMPSAGGSISRLANYLEEVNPTLRTLFLSESPEQLPADSIFVRKPLTIHVLAKALTNLLETAHQDFVLRAR
jgi:CheY-like chemotaxis protein